MLIRVLLAGLFAGGTPGAKAEEPREPHGFAFPQDFETYRMTSAFDLDRSGGRADWMGWKAGDPTSGSGHAYDNHSGSDFGMGNGTALYAIADGRVTSALDTYPTDDHSGGGNYLIFSHTVDGATFTANFWHLNYLGALKNTGDRVSKGEQVAWSDNTGNSTGPHLHYGIRKDSGSGGTGLYSCPFYHAWWEGDEFYYGDSRACLVYVRIDPGIGSLNCREGASTAYNIITSLPAGAAYVASQRNGWWRIFLPLPPARAYENRDAFGDLSAGYAETGTWHDDAAKSPVVDAIDDANRVVLEGAGSRYSGFAGAGGAETARFPFTSTQKGEADVYVTYPEPANARNVTYRIAHRAGTTDVVLHQRGAYGAGGTGGQADPYVIESAPYTVSHTTIGGGELWDSYAPAGSGIPEYGPERIYELTVYRTSSVRISVEHPGYPALDVDLQLLGSLSNNDCLARADWEIAYDNLIPGTYYISVDSYGTSNSRATDYVLTVEPGNDEPFANRWVWLGRFGFDANAAYSVEVREGGVTGPVNAGFPGRVYADAIKIVPVATHRSGFCSDSTVYSRRINTSSEPVACVVFDQDLLSGDDSRDVADAAEFPIYAAPGSGGVNGSQIVAKAVTGQRFVCSERTPDGWYRVYLTNGTSALSGWVNGNYVRIYNAASLPLVPGGYLGFY